MCFAFYGLTDLPKDYTGCTDLKSLLELKTLTGDFVGEEDLAFQSLPITSDQAGSLFLCVWSSTGDHIQHLGSSILQ